MSKNGGESYYPNNKYKESFNHNIAKIKKNWLFERLNKIYRPLTRTIKEKKTQINKIRNDSEVRTDATEIQRSQETTMRNYTPINGQPGRSG